MNPTIGVIIATTLIAIPTSQAADGKEVYTAQCVKCHGEDGKGKTKMGQKLGSKDYTQEEVPAKAFDTLKQGIKDGEKVIKKPAEISDDEIRAALEYMKKFKK